MTLTVRTDRRLIRSTAHSQRFVLVRLVAPVATREPTRRPPVNVALVLDRSGSMGAENKIGLARRAADAALDRLHDPDRFAVVVYDDRVDVLVEGTGASAEAKRNAHDRLAATDARGTTDLAGGWLRGAEQVALRPDGAAVNRTLLLTDGLANVGITDPDQIVHHAAELRSRGVSTSTFGVGTDVDEGLLGRMAQAGGGHYYWIQDARQIPDYLASEVGEATEVVAHGASLDVTTADGVVVEPISPYPFATRGNRTSIELGDIVSGQDLEIVVRFTFPFGDPGREVGAILSLSDADGAFAAAAGAGPARLLWTYADHHANDAQQRDRDVDRAVARIFAARARVGAAALNRAGRFGEAAAMMAGVARRVASYAGRDAELRAIVSELEGERVAWAAPMAVAERQARHFAATAFMQSRGPEGRVRRG